MTGVLTFLDRATTYIGKNAVEAGVVHNLHETYIDYLYKTHVEKQSLEDLIENNPVTDQEIEQYRTYYGTMDEQIANIKAQYENANEEEKKIRDQKIDDIRANFTDDEHVRTKVEALKRKTIEGYIQERSNNVEPFDKAQHFNYQIEIEDQDMIEKTESSKPISELTRTYNGNKETHSLDSFHYANNDVSIMFSVNVNTPSAVIKTELLQSIYKDANYGDEIENFEWRKMAFYIVWLLTAITIIYLVIKREKVKQTFTELLAINLPKFTRYIDVNACIVLLGIWMAFGLANSMGKFIESIVYNLYYGQSMIGVISHIIQFIMLIAITVFTLLVAVKLIDQLRAAQYSKEQFISTKFVQYVKEVFYNRSLATQMVAALIVFACAGFGVAVVMIQFVAILLYIPLFIAIVIPTLYMFVRRFAYLSRVIRHTEKLANGQTVQPIQAKGQSLISKHAENINKLQAGVIESVQAQAKSERMKTELITNVSHDLRTPLTSIITYTDLLKSDNITEKERQKYIAILESKSHRLKTLIEDLFEVSKMASGNIEIQRQSIDIAQLLQQIVVEHEEDFEQAGLALRMTIEEQPLIMQADGQKLWRVIDNLLTNARKYSLSNTRVYVSLTKEHNQVVITIKNVTKYELGENVDELTERFKRGDASRNTDGSGLGLAIAQSIVELHAGTMQIDLNGDLFQVTVRIPS